jgi:hypothetical protein
MVVRMPPICDVCSADYVRLYRKGPEWNAAAIPRLNVNGGSFVETAPDLGVFRAGKDFGAVYHWSEAFGNNETFDVPWLQSRWTRADLRQGVKWMFEPFPFSEILTAHSHLLNRQSEGEMLVARQHSTKQYPSSCMVVRESPQAPCSKSHETLTDGRKTSTKSASIRVPERPLGAPLSDGANDQETD